MTVGRSENGSDDLWIGEMGLSARNGKTVDRRNWKWIGEKWDRSEKRVQKTHRERRQNRSLDRSGSDWIGADQSGSECGSEFAWSWVRVDRSEQIGVWLVSGSEWADRERIGVMIVSGSWADRSVARERIGAGFEWIGVMFVDCVGLGSWADRSGSARFSSSA